MNKPRILMTGASGLLGTELSKHIEVITTRFDITGDIPRKNYDLVIHSAAYTDVVKAEGEKKKCFETNVYGTFNVVNAYKDTPFVYISTEYAKNPLGVYALSKYLGEEVVKTHPKYLIIRTLFKPRPWPFDKAYSDQYTQGDYLDVIAELVAQKIKEWDTKTSELCYVGTGRKTMYELAQRTKPEVEPNTVEDYRKKVGNIIPYDYE